MPTESEVVVVDIAYDKEAKQTKTKKEKKVSSTDMFKYISVFQKLLVLLGVVASLGQGVIMPVFTIYMGNMINAFSVVPEGVDLSKLADMDMSAMAQTFDKSILNDCIYTILVLGAVSFAMMFIMTAALKFSSESNGLKIRQLYMKASITQEMGWYDSKKAGEITEHFGGDLEKIQGGIGTKFGTIYMGLSTFFGGWIVGFIRGWRLALIILAVTPLLIIVAIYLSVFMQRFTLQTQDRLAKAGGVAEEVIVSVRTVTALNCQEFSAQRYEKHLDEAYAIGQKKTVILSTSFGAFFFLLFGIYGLAFWYGAYLVRENIMDAGLVMNVFMAVIMGAMSVTQMAPNLQAFGEARGAAYEVFETIDRVSEIDPFCTDGKVVDIKGNIEFDKVRFYYPTRPTVQVLKGVSLKVSPGETLALVGPSGCGKSTTVGLLERFYNIAEGSIKIDGIPIEDINIPCLREQIGIVGQEPVLFAMTIKDNIKLGSKKDRSEISDEKVFEAAKMANIYDFIMSLPKQFETMVGERGVQLSGGQKQRIAIARALIKNPNILILDEATSALDTESEGIVQQALENASKGRTTIIIAHRLSTVKNANQIIVLENGIIKEQGNHQELMKVKGLYRQLVERQQIHQAKKSAHKANKLHEKKGKTKKTKKSIKAPKPGKKITTIEDENLLPDEEENTDSSSSSSSSLNSVSPSLGVTPPPSSRDKAKEATKKEKRDDKKFEEEDLTQHQPYTKKRHPFLRTFKFIKPNAHFLVTGVLGAVMNGAIMPVFAIVFSEIMVVLLTPSLNEEMRKENKKDADFWALMFIVIAVCAALSMVLLVVGLATNGERLMRTVRSKTFRGFLRQNVGFFDDQINSTGTLTTRLATDALLIESATGFRIGTALQSVASIVIGIIVGFTGSWVMALIITACMPFLCFAQFFNIRFVVRAEKDLKKSYEDSSNYAVEAVESIRTVAMLGQESYFINGFEQELKPAHRRSNFASFTSAIASAFVGLIQMYISALAMYVMSRILESGSGDMQGSMRAQMAIMFGAMSVTQMAAIQSDVSKAFLAMKHFFRALDRTPLIDSEATRGVKKEIKGEVEFKDIEFIYPTRKQTTILRGFNLKIPVGKTMALVGPSGCGKSTTVGMIERFYDPKNGEVLIDGRNIKDYNIRSLRSQVGLVSQEPTLFGMSIKENIKMGAIDREVTDDEIIAACKKANAHKFIKALPEGYDTQTGEKGAQLSGGQKQRIAIARSLVANPKILLLDEATSALDTESEAIVQQALDRASEGRTTIIIAHRLSTVQKADCIAVIKKGKVIEMGTHNELIQQTDSEYYRLASKQLKKEIPVHK